LVFVSKIILTQTRFPAAHVGVIVPLVIVRIAAAPLVILTGVILVTDGASAAALAEHAHPSVMMFACVESQVPGLQRDSTE
jgi:hypothetical protein